MNPGLSFQNVRICIIIHSLGTEFQLFGISLARKTQADNTLPILLSMTCVDGSREFQAKILVMNELAYFIFQLVFFYKKTDSGGPRITTVIESANYGSKS